MYFFIRCFAAAFVLGTRASLRLCEAARSSSGPASSSTDTRVLVGDAWQFCSTHTLAERAAPVGVPFTHGHMVNTAQVSGLSRRDPLCKYVFNYYF